MAMNKFWKKRWIEALESGKYKQATDVLKSVGNKKTQGMCCLGVLCDVAGAKWKRPADPFASARARVATIEAFDLVSGNTQLGDEMRDFFGITKAQQDELTTMNDDEGKSFADIAKHIRKKL